MFLINSGSSKTNSVTITSFDMVLNNVSFVLSFKALMGYPYFVS